MDDVKCFRGEIAARVNANNSHLCFGSYMRVCEYKNISI